MSEAISITSRTAGRIDSADRIEARDAGVRRPSASGDAAATRSSDRVEVSSAARYLAELKTLSGVREDVVAGVRESLADGSYDVADRVDAILDRVLDDIETLEG